MDGEGVAANAADLRRHAVQAHDLARQLDLRLLRVAVTAQALEASLARHCGHMHLPWVCSYKAGSRGT